MKFLRQKNYKLSLLFLGIIVLAFIVRLYKIEGIPPGLNRDEAAIGYTAYSILKTGRDEFGRWLPLSLESFGDWKLPLYAYAAIPTVFFLGLTDLAVRMPSLLFGTFTIILTYFVTLRLLGNKKIGLLSSFLIAISPWHLFFSRVASEANFAVWLTLISLLLITFAKGRPVLLIISAFVLNLTLLTYHGNHIFTPLLFIGLIFFFRELFFTKVGFISIFIFVFGSILIYSQTIFTADKTKLSGLLAINDVSIVHEQIVKNRILFDIAWIGKIYNNKLVFLIENIFQNYLRTLSPEFFFIKGGTNSQHNIPQAGNLYIVEAPFLFIGLFLVIRKKVGSILLYWILISGIGAALTKDAPHSARQFAVYPAISIAIAYGMVYFFSKIKFNLLKVCLLLVFSLALGGSVSLFLSRYFVLFPYNSYSIWGGVYKELSYKIHSYENNSYQNIVISRPDYSPYIYYLFYNKVDPGKVQSQLYRYPPTSEGFVHAKSYQRLQFQKIDWADDLLKPNRLYIDWVESIPSGATNSAVLITKDLLTQLKERGVEIPDINVGSVVRSELIDSIVLPNKTPYMYFIRTWVDTYDTNRLNK